jgi:hypothetical protein
MMTLGLMAACVPMALPAAAVAQSAAADARFRAAQERFDREYRLYRDEVERYQQMRGGRPGPANAPRDGRYRDAPDQYDPDYGGEDVGYYDPAPDYRPGTQYRERVLGSDERVYAGEDGRYYCRRSDGTTGLIVGAAGGGLLGNVIDGGRSRTVGTLLGGAAGALAGRAVERGRTDIRCR